MTKNLYTKSYQQTKNTPSKTQRAHIQNLILEAQKKIHKFHLGKTRSHIKGSGIEFHDLKEYSHSDDIKNIAWNVSTQDQKLYVKRYLEEQEAQFIVAFDISASQLCGSQTQIKKDYANSIASLLLLAAHYNHYNNGLCLFTNKVEYYSKPKAKRTNFWIILQQLLFYNAKEYSTSIKQACLFLLKTIKKRSLICLISDFIDTNYEKELMMLGKKHDVFAIHIIDPLDVNPPKIKHIRIHDSESHVEKVISLNKKACHEKYNLLYHHNQKALFQICKKAKIEIFQGYTNKPHINKLIQFLKKRLIN